MGLTDQEKNAVDEDEGRSNMIFVSEPCKGEHDDGGEDVGWGNETLGSSNTKAHTVFQNDRQEVSNSVRVGCSEPEECCEAPDFQIHSVFQVFTNVECLWDGIMTVFFDSGNDERSLFLGEELELETTFPRRLFWEVCNEKETHEANDTGENSLHNARDSQFCDR